MNHNQCCKFKWTWNTDDVVSHSQHKIYHMISISMLWIWVNMKYWWCCEYKSTWNISSDILIMVVSPSQHEIGILLWVQVNMKYITWYHNQYCDVVSLSQQKYITWYYNQCFESESTWNTDDVVSSSQHKINHIKSQSMLWVWVNMKYWWCCEPQST